MSKLAEDSAVVALGTSLRIAAMLSTVAAKTASMAFSSFASGADKFAQLVREEASKNNHNHRGSRGRVQKTRASVRKVRTKTAS